MTKCQIDAYDFSYIIAMDPVLEPDDIVVTGLSRDHEKLIKMIVKEKKIDKNKLYTHTISIKTNNHKRIGFHKGITLFYLELMGINFKSFFTGDPIQAKEIEKIMPYVNVVMSQK